MARTVGGPYPDRASRPDASHHFHGPFPSSASLEIPDPTLMFPTSDCPIPTRLEQLALTAPAVHLAGPSVPGLAGVPCLAFAFPRLAARIYFWSATFCWIEETDTRGRSPMASSPRPIFYSDCQIQFLPGWGIG